MKEKFPQGGNFYMIGDNPLSDIKGANDAGWTSLLTKTGVFKGTGNDEENPAHIVVHDFYEAIEQIMKKEGLSV
jgi:ribonucleotide monophosphatase NagD (HAD superfamily)